MRTFKAIEIIFASTIATLMLASGAAAQQHYSRFEDRLADRAAALQSAPAADRAPAVSWYERKTSRGIGASDAAGSEAIAPVVRFHEQAPSCSATLAARPQRPWCG